MNDWIVTIGGWAVQIVTIGGAIIAIYAWFAKPLKQLRTAVAEIKSDVSDVKDDTGDLLCDMLTQAQDCYVRKGYCSGSDKKRLCDMHKRYRELGRNHLADNWEKNLLELPEKPVRKPARKKEVVL